MISRVAESCFWLSRYLERAETTARWLAVNSALVLDAEIQDTERWLPMITVAGERQRFVELCGAAAFNDDDVAQRYLTWEERNPISIRESLRGARENARTIREVISSEMWQVLNGAWQYINTPAARSQYQDHRQAFYSYVQEVVWQVQGVAQSTMLHEEAFIFTRLGQLLERVSQTARILDVKYHMLSAHPERPDEETPQETAQWAALLRYCSATEPFFQRSMDAPSGRRVAEFLIKDRTFPRALLHCLDRCRHFLKLIHESTGTSEPSYAIAIVEALIEHVSTRSTDQLLGAGIHAELTAMIDKIAQAGTLIHLQYFDPHEPDVSSIPDSRFIGSS